MMEQFSPLTRRIIAIALLVLVAMSTIGLFIIPVATSISDAMNRLQDARFRLARMTAIAQRPPLPSATPLPPQSFLRANDQNLAQQQYLKLLTAAATRVNLQIGALSAEPSLSASPHQISARLSVRGTEASVVQFIDAVEAGTPLSRFQNWRIASIDGQAGQVQFDGVAVAAWGSTQ